MSKFYSDRYVKPQTSRASMNYGDFSNSGKLVETIICVALGSIVFYVLCSMAFAFLKPMMSKVDTIKQEQSMQTDYFDKILNGDYEVNYNGWNNRR